MRCVVLVEVRHFGGVATGKKSAAPVRPLVDIPVHCPNTAINKTIKISRQSLAIREETR
jgi:hypothetical protein